jgi:hypothetical protein
MHEDVKELSFEDFETDELSGTMIIVSVYSHYKRLIKEHAENTGLIDWSTKSDNIEKINNRIDGFINELFDLEYRHPKEDFIALYLYVLSLDQNNKVYLDQSMRKIYNLLTQNKYNYWWLLYFYNDMLEINFPEQYEAEIKREQERIEELQKVASSLINLLKNLGWEEKEIKDIMEISIKLIKNREKENEDGCICRNQK